MCIKTDFVDNIQFAVNRGIWVAMDKVGARITRLWNERGSEKDMVLLLFSVNGQKSYCGLATLRGPWSSGGDYEGWKENDKESKILG